MPRSSAGPKQFWVDPKFLGLVQSFLSQSQNILCHTKRRFQFRKFVFCAGAKVFEEAPKSCNFMNLPSFAKMSQYNDYSLSLTIWVKRVIQIHRKILEIDEPTVDSRCPGKQEGCCEITESYSQEPSRTVIGKSQVSKVHTFWEGNKILWNLHLRFVLYSNVS